MTQRQVQEMGIDMVVHWKLGMGGFTRNEEIQ